MTSAAEKKIRRFTEQPLAPGDPSLRPKGRALIIGGHEDKKGDKLILRQLARRVGSGKLIVTTLASNREDETWEEYESVFRGLGVPHVYHLRIEERADGRSPRAMKILDDATAVFFTGGDQVRITSLIGDTPVFSRMYEIFVDGGLIAGTSAGAAIMSETMIVDGDAEESARVSGDLELAPGLGFVKDVVVDQHFAERGRIARLLSVVAHNPRMLGIGIDENTAIELRPARDFRVYGDGGVTIVDGRTVGFTNLAQEDRDRTMSLHGVTLHVLSQGDYFDLKRRLPRPRPAEDVDRELGIETSDDDDDDDEGEDGADEKK